MTRPLRIQFPGAYYLVTCRGNERRRIFKGSKDYAIFCEILARSLEIYNVCLLSYVLMPNHFHLLITTPEGNLSEFMRHFNIIYTASFNRRHNRVGNLYQGRYKSFLIDVDQYLLEVSRYIHVNPVRIDALMKKSQAEKWGILLKDDTSSLRGFLSVNKRKSFMDYGRILDRFGGDNPAGRQAYGRFVKSGVTGRLENPLETANGSSIVGGSDFINWVKRKFIIRKSHPVREQHTVRELRKEYSPEELIKHFSKLMKTEDLIQRGKQSTERAMLMEILYRLCRITQPEIGKLVGGIDHSAVSLARKRFRQKLMVDSELKEQFQSTQERLSQMSKVKT
ncbi:MAG TPA: transposase [Syntrophales bacterium]|nr:transposase [Syntrophales bacterium]